MTRRLTLGLLFLLALAGLPGTARAERLLPPHKDPATVSRRVPSQGVFEFYTGVFGRISREQYAEAQALLKQRKELKTPANSSFVSQQFGDILERVVSNMDQADTELRRRAALLGQGQEELATANLGETLALLDEANGSLRELRGLMDLLTVRAGGPGALAAAVAPAGPPGAPSGDPVSEQRRQMGSSLNQVEQVSTRYGQLAETLGLGQTPPTLPPRSYAVSLSLDAPPLWYAGRAEVVSAAVAYPQGLDSTPVGLQLSLDDRVLGQVEVAGPFQAAVTLPADTEEGPHVLALQLPAQEPYEATLATQRITVIKAQPLLEVSAPRVAFSPQVQHVSGEVTSTFGPLQNALLSLKLGGQVTSTRTDAQGNFFASLSLPAMQFSPGPQRLRVSALPQEPWNGQVERELRTFVVGVPHLVLLLLLAIYGVVVSRMAWRRWQMRPATVPGALAGGVSPLGGIMEGGPWAAVPARAFAEPGSPRGRVVIAYFNAAQFLVLRTATPLRPVFTLRDFLRTVGAAMGSSFAGLTSLAEKALYRRREPDEEDVRQAEELAERVKAEA